jgi:hypothetical protein
MPGSYGHRGGLPQASEKTTYIINQLTLEERPFPGVPYLPRNVSCGRNHLPLPIAAGASTSGTGSGARQLVFFRSTLPELPAPASVNFQHRLSTSAILK